MLKIILNGDEVYDEENSEFHIINGTELLMEHSLVSLSKWESKFEKPFLSKVEKTQEEMLGYIHCMILSPEIPIEALAGLSQQNILDINAYIEAKMTATWFSETQPKTRSSEIITSELIYYWMNRFEIPIECENWHLNRLFTLIKIHNLKSEKPKKMSREEAARRQRELNAQRRAQMGTSG